MRVIQLNESSFLAYKMLGLKADEWFKNKIYEHLKNLPKKSRELRFFNVPSDEVLRKYADGIKYESDGVFVIEDKNEIVAFLHAPVISDSEVEFALSVLSEYEGRGLGTKLFSRAYKWARDNGYKKIVTVCLSSNKGMQAIVRKYETASISAVEFNVNEGIIPIESAFINPIYEYMSRFVDNMDIWNIHLNNMTTQLVKGTE